MIKGKGEIVKVGERDYRTVWVENGKVKVIDQRWLPHRFVIEELKTVDDVCKAIKEMHVRGAGCIGATAGFGMYIAARDVFEGGFSERMREAADKLVGTRPTAVNLSMAVERVIEGTKTGTLQERQAAALRVAQEIADEDVDFCRKIGEQGLGLIRGISEKKAGRPVNILTHCNAGWLAFVDHGSATAPIYAAHKAGVSVHVWVSETRPRNQGARLTAWELEQEGVPHTVIADNVSGHLLQKGLVDMVIVGADRATYTGDVANKIGTYMKAVAARDNNVPFYVALPSTSFDWILKDGKEIPIEQRGGEEVREVQGLHQGEVKRVLVTPGKSKAVNYAFDVTPKRLVTGLITERGICGASEQGIRNLFPEKLPEEVEANKGIGEEAY